MMGYLHQIIATEKIAIILFPFLSFFSFEASAVRLQIQTPSKQSVYEKAENQPICKIALFKPHFQRQLFQKSRFLSLH